MTMQGLPAAHIYDVTARFMGDTVKYTVQVEGASNPTEELNMALKAAHTMADNIFERKAGAGAAPVVSVQLA